MTVSRRLLYFFCFAGLASVGALSIARIAKPPMDATLVFAAVVAAVAGAPALVHRRAWPAALLLLLPVGAYLVARLVLPLPAGVHGLGRQLSFYFGALGGGGHTYATNTFPLDLSNAAELKLLLAIIVYGATGLASFVALSLRKALPAIVIFLILLGFSLTVDGSDKDVFLSIAFLVLAGYLLALSRTLERTRWRPADAGAGAATAIVGVLLALFLLTATPVSASKPWRDWRTWSIAGAQSVHPSFQFMLNYPSLLDPRTDRPVMRVEAPQASYWRANALESFDGTTWKSTASPGDQLVAEGGQGSYGYTVPLSGPSPHGKPVIEHFSVTSMSTGFLFAGGTPQVISASRKMSVSETSVQALRLAKSLGPAFAYQVAAVLPQVKPADLVSLGRDYPQSLLPYTQLPFPSGAESQSQWLSDMRDVPAMAEWLGLYQLNQRIVAGATDPYEITLRIETYLRANYVYSLTPPKSRDKSPYAAFLFDTRVGYCQHFAGAMAALLRFNGIPARVAVGFTNGALVAADTFQVTTNDAHAWVEVYFPGVGWVPFDPTPGRGLPGAGPSTTNTGFVDPFPQDAAGIGSTAIATPTPTPGGPLPNADPGGAASTGSQGVRHGIPGWLPWLLAFVAVLLGWPAGRVLLRLLRLRRGAPDARMRTSVALVYAGLRDYGFEVPPSQTLEETSRFLQDRLNVDATPLAERVQAVLYGGRPAGEGDVVALAALRRRLKHSLRASQGWFRTVLATYGLRHTPR
jgi:protein-glutamine gamma-glutamyltransferase